MFTKLRKKSKLDVEIDRKLDDLRRADQSPRFDQIMSQLEKLYKMKEAETSRRVSPDTWALIGANLFGILIIVTHEYTNPVTTKALQFAIKPK